MGAQRFHTYRCAKCGNVVEVVKAGGGSLSCCGQPMVEVEQAGTDPERHFILGVHITDRVKHVPSVQAVLTEFGCSIKTRLGLHHADEKFCSPNGLMLLEIVGGESVCTSMIEKLSAVEGVEVKPLIFGHP